MNLIKKLFSPVCLTISIFLLVYSFYRSEIYWEGRRTDYYFIYYLISSVLILCSIITFFISEKIKTYLIITLISVVFSLYAFETYLTFDIGVDSQLDNIQNEQLKKKNIKLYKQQTGKDYDIRTRFEIYNDLKKEDENVVVTVNPKTYFTQQNKLFPLSGISNSKTINCNENGYYSIYQSDRYGFNNPDSEWNKKEIEYLLVGDSFAQGDCVNRPEDIASVLRTLSEKSVLNLGYGGNGPLIEYATLREYLKPNIKNVLWVFFDNDTRNLDYELNSEILTSYLKDLNFTQNLKSKQNQIDELAIQMINTWHMEMEKIEIDFIYLIKLNQVRGILNNYLPKKYQPHERFQVPQFKEILKFAKELSIKNNSNFYFVYLPEYLRFKTSYNNNLYHQVKKIVEELNIPFIDVYKEVLEKESNPLKLLPFELWGHYNAEGYRKIAEAIHKFISK